MSSCKKGIDPKEAWQSVIQPCIITRWSNKRALAYGARAPGRALIISTPKGYNFFHEMFTYAEMDKAWRSYQYSYLDSPFLDPVEIEKIRHTIDPVQFASEYLASFEESGNNVFYCFDRKKHVRDDLPDFIKPENGEKGEDIHINIDFNVGYLRLTINLVNSGDLSKETILSQALDSNIFGRCNDYPEREYSQAAGSARHFWDLDPLKEMKI